MSEPIKSYSIEQVEKILSDARLSPFRAGQILSWIYGKNASSYEEMTNIPKVIREQMTLAYPLYKPEVVVKQESEDASRKYLLKYHDDTLVEAVGLPSEDGRLTVCCSTQSGCAMSCDFCATASLGLKRSLHPGEIVDQVLALQEDYGMRVSNVVMMGQGEPFMNYDATIAALHILNNEKLVNIGSRRMTVSTCGILKGIERFSDEKEQFTLAVSLHSARQEVRDAIMPGMKGQPLKDLRETLVRYVEKTGRRITFEYALMKAVNDGPEDLLALVSYCRHLLCHVNLIPLNNVEGSPYRPVSRAIMDEWKDELEKKGVAATVRRSLGQDIAAACGQLNLSAQRKGIVRD